MSEHALDLQNLIAATRAFHKHLCPRQVLGVRMGVLAEELLSVEFPHGGHQDGPSSADQSQLSVSVLSWAVRSPGEQPLVGSLEAYQVMPDRELLRIDEVRLQLSLEALVGKPGIRVNCESCGEEILNGRERRADLTTLCGHCAGEKYWSPA